MTGTTLERLSLKRSLTLFPELKKNAHAQGCVLRTRDFVVTAGESQLQLAYTGHSYGMPHGHAPRAHGFLVPTIEVRRDSVRNSYVSVAVKTSIN